MGFSLLYLVPNKCLCLQSQPDFCRAPNIQISLCMRLHPKWSNEYLKTIASNVNHSLGYGDSNMHQPKQHSAPTKTDTTYAVTYQGKVAKPFLRRGLPISSLGKFEKATLYAQGDLEGPHSLRNTQRITISMEDSLMVAAQENTKQIWYMAGGHSISTYSRRPRGYGSPWAPAPRGPIGHGSPGIRLAQPKPWNQ